MQLIFLHFHFVTRPLVMVTDDKEDTQFKQKLPYTQTAQGL